MRFIGMSWTLGSYSSSHHEPVVLVSLSLSVTISNETARASSCCDSWNSSDCATLKPLTIIIYHQYQPSLTIIKQPSLTITSNHHASNKFESLNINAIYFQHNLNHDFDVIIVNYEPWLATVGNHLTIQWIYPEPTLRISGGTARVLSSVCNCSDKTLANQCRVREFSLGAWVELHVAPKWRV